jgi:hypothetical protein
MLKEHNAEKRHAKKKHTTQAKPPTFYRTKFCDVLFGHHTDALCRAEFLHDENVP